jgi:hypothetical protein
MALHVRQQQEIVAEALRIGRADEVQPAAAKDQRKKSA